MPTPAAGLLIASFPLILHFGNVFPAINSFMADNVNDWVVNKWLLYGLIVFLSWLMVSNIPLLALKFKDAKQVGALEGFGLPLGSKETTISGSRFMLAGDAASLIDPISGDGIGNAMLSGKLAADQAIKSFKEVDFSAANMRNYDRSVYKKIGGKLVAGTFLMKSIKYFPPLFTILSTVMQNRKFMNRVIKFFKI